MSSTRQAPPPKLRRSSEGGSRYTGAPSRRCIAFVHSEAHDELWTPCGAPAERPAQKTPGSSRQSESRADFWRNGGLCRYHCEALAGIVLGLLERPDGEALESEEEACREALRVGARYFANQYWQGKARQEERRADRAASPPASGGSIRHDPTTSLRVMVRETEP